MHLTAAVSSRVDANTLEHFAHTGVIGFEPDDIAFQLNPQVETPTPSMRETMRFSLYRRARHLVYAVSSEIFCE